MPDYQVKRGTYNTPLEGISSAPGVVTHVRSVTMTSLRRAQELNGTSREAATLRSVRSDLKSMAQFCTQNRLDQATGKVKPRNAGSDTPRGAEPQVSPVDSPEKQEVRSPEHRSGTLQLQSTSILSASKSLRGSANSRPTLRNGTTGTRTRSPSATSFKGASPAVAPTRLFQPRSNEASSHLATTRAGVVPSTSRVTATAHSPKRKISQSLVVQVRPRSGSFTNGTPGPLSAGAGAMTSPGRGKATVRQTSTGPAVRKRSGPLATTPTPVVAPEPEPVQAAPTPPPPPPAPQVEEEYVADNPGQVPREVVCTAFDENNAVMCFGNAEEWDIHRVEPLRMQIWWRQGGPSVTICGFHPEPINSVSICHGTRPAEAANATATPSSTSETSQSGGAEMQWLATCSRSCIFVFRLDRLLKAVGDAIVADESCEDQGRMSELIEAVTPQGPLSLAHKSLAKSWVNVWTYPGEEEVPPIGVVACRTSPRGHLVVACTKEGESGKVILHFVTKQMEVVRVQVLGWSDPLGECCVTDVVPMVPPPQDRSQERMCVWFSGVGAKLYSCEANIRDKGMPKRLHAHMNLLPNNPVSCLCGSVKRASRCFVGCKMAMVQVMEWRDESSGQANLLGKVQIPGEDADVLAMRSLLRGGEEVLVMMLEHAIYLQRVVTSNDGCSVTPHSEPTLVVSFSAISCPLLPTLLSMNNGMRSASALNGNLQVSWIRESGLERRLCLATVKSPEWVAAATAPTASAVPVVPVVPVAGAGAMSAKEDSKTEPRRHSLNTANERGSPLTTPRGGTVRRKPLNGAGSFAPRPASSRGENTMITEGRKDGRRMVSGPSAAGKATVLNVARTVKRNPRVPNKVASDEGTGHSTHAPEQEVQARIDRVPSPATQRQPSLETALPRSGCAPSARTERPPSQEKRAPEEQWATKVTRYQQHQTWAPPAGTSTPLWGVKAPNMSTINVTPNPVTVARGPSVDMARTTLHPQGPQIQAPCLQGLSSWPTVWVPQAIPATPLNRHSMGQTLAPGQNVPQVPQVNAQVIHRGIINQAPPQVLLEETDLLSRSRRTQPFVQSIPTAHPAFLHRWPFH